MGGCAYRAWFGCFACALLGVGQQAGAGRGATKSSPTELAGLVLQLRDAQANWMASARLQTLGDPAVAALVEHLRQDPFADHYHGNHSATMKALEKIGESALPRLAAALTPQVLKSKDKNDVEYVDSVLLVMVRINRSLAAQHLIRVAHFAANLALRASVLNRLLVPEAHQPTLPRTDRWGPCIGVDRDHCPDRLEAPAMVAALRPILPEIAMLLKDAPTADIKLAAAHILARWGAGEFKREGERQLIAMATNARPSVRFQAIQALGSLGVRSSLAVLRNVPVNSDEGLKRATAEALFRLGDAGYVPLVTELMRSENEETRRWSIGFARTSQNSSFVPDLIDRLQDRGWNGASPMALPPEQKVAEKRHTLSENALDALRRLTFQEFGPEAGEWRRWWEVSRPISWEALLSQYVQSRMTKMAGADPSTLDQWMERLSEADSPVVLPFVKALLAHPRLDLSGGNGRRSILLLLLELVNQGNAGAKELLSSCLATKDYDLRKSCPLAVAVFDRQKALNWLNGKLGDHDPYVALLAAESLAYLGDPRGIPRLIGELGAAVSIQRRAAYRTLKQYTQAGITYDPDAPVAARSEAITQWRRWWDDNQSNFRVRVRAAQIDTEYFR